MDIEVIASNLSRELIKGKPLIQCWQVAQMLDKVLQQRERTILLLSEAAGSLDKHVRKASIAKTVGSGAGVGGKTTLGVGVAALLGAPLTGGISLVATVACLAVGGTVTALGMLTTAGTYIVEYILCSREFKKVEKALEDDKNYVNKLCSYWSELEHMFEDFCKANPSVDMSKILHAVLSVFSKVNQHVTGSSVDWEGISKMANSKMVVNMMEKVVNVIKPIISTAFSTATSVALSGLCVVGTGMASAVGIGAVLLSLDLAVLVRNAFSLATNEGHSATAEIRSKIEKLEDERKYLQALREKFQQHLQQEDTSYNKYGILLILGLFVCFICFVYLLIN